MGVCGNVGCVVAVVKDSVFFGLGVLKNFMYVWLYVFLFCTRACVCRCDGDVICVGHDLNWYSRWWYVCSVYVE